MLILLESKTNKYSVQNALLTIFRMKNFPNRQRFICERVSQNRYQFPREKD